MDQRSAQPISMSRDQRTKGRGEGEGERTDRLCNNFVMVRRIYMIFWGLKAVMLLIMHITSSVHDRNVKFKKHQAELQYIQYLICKTVNYRSKSGEFSYHLY